MNFDERVKAVAEFGFTERQGRFLVTVMLHAGVCVPRQYAKFAGTAYGHKVTRFFDKLVQREHATVSGCLHNRAEVYHIRHQGLYRAVGQPHSRYRRPVPASQVLHRLMRLDAIVIQPDLVWLATQDEKAAFFNLMAPSLAVERLPHVTVGNGAARRVRLFPEDQPIGVTTTGRVVFIYLVTTYDTEPLRTFVQRHADLLQSLPGWTLRLVFPPQLADGAKRCEAVVRDELTPLRPEVLSELKWYFGRRRSTPNARALSFENPEFWQDQAAFSAPRFQQLYRRWLVDGDSVFEAVASSAIRDTLERGTGRIESQVLRLSYRHLTPLVSQFRSYRKGVEGGETLAAQPQPPRSESLSCRDRFITRE
jgi:hypothetical protein